MKKLGRIMRELRRFWRVLPMVGVACMMAGCDDSENNVSPEENERKSVSLTRSEQELVTANNDFAFNLFRVADAQNSTILSPISITYALGMLNNGAAGETQAQINKVLGENAH